MPKVNSRLWQKIEESGLKRWVIAVRAQVSPKRLSQIVRGHQKPTTNQRQCIAEVMGVPSEDIFSSD